METRTVLSVDAFADEPLGGVAVPVLPEASLSATQLRAVAAEFGASGAVAGDTELFYAARGVSAPVCAAVGGVLGLGEHGDLEPGTHTLACADGPDLTVTLEADRRVTVTVDQTVEPAGVETDELAEMLGVPVAAIDDVDLPVGRADGFGGSLLVPLMFLEHLGELSPDADSLAALSVERLFAFTFDTLAAETDVHARAFDSSGREWATSGLGAAGCAQFLDTQAAFEADTEWIRIESGRFCDRPATLDVLFEDGTVAGRGLIALDGTIVVPADEEDEIVEL